MGTPPVSPPRHEAGEFVQAQADRIRLGTLLTVLGALVVLAVAYVVLGGHGPILIGIGVLALAVAVVVPRVRDQEADRWARGARGERKVGAALEALGDDWHVLQISGLAVEPLLVFSDAYLVGDVPAHRRGVTILPARVLPRFIARRRPKLTDAEAADIATRLRLALEDDAR